MSKHSILCGLILITLGGLNWGCARASLDTTGYALHEAATVSAPFEDTWQALKTVLREQDLEIYTRDKRGVFVAYSPTRRSLLQPTRLQHTFELERIGANETRITAETIRQVYGVTLLTYPDWHDRPAEDNADAQQILAMLQESL